MEKKNFKFFFELHRVTKVKTDLCMKNFLQKNFIFYLQDNSTTFLPVSSLSTFCTSPAANK